MPTFRPVAVAADGSFIGQYCVGFRAGDYKSRLPSVAHVKVIASRNYRYRPTGC